VKAVVVECDVLTAYGRGLDACWQGLLSGKTAISTVDRFETGACRTSQAGIIPFLDAGRPESLCMQMLESLFDGVHSRFPSDALTILASTTGEIDLLERNILHGEGDREESCLTNLLKKTQRLLGNRSEGFVISAACTSSAAAIVEAAALVGEGAEDSVLVVSCDAVTEFVFAGFSSLLALAEERATPFDRDCRGLTVGEAAACTLIMSEDRALREKRPILGEIAGWGMTNDINHMTGPSRDGQGLARAIEGALGQGRCGTDDVGSVCAHGTGTAYNDNMEMKAFRLVFGDLPVPVYSIKGGIGHTLGAAGLVELAVLLRSMEEGVAPPTVGCRNVIDDAVGWVSPAPQTLKDLPFALCTNSGFGGINTALLVRSRESLDVRGALP
jgi:3-oxoacyl-[acyl-carrier-protein] synthase II